jgi:hypothetical protein
MQVLSVMTDLAEQGALVSPALVIRDCKDYAEYDQITVWIKAVAGHFRDSNPDYAAVEQVMLSCPDLINLDDQEENAEVEVLALALQRLEHSDVRVVSGQWSDLPDRAALGPSAGRVDVEALRVEEFIREILSI